MSRLLIAEKILVSALLSFCCVQFVFAVIKFTNIECKGFNDFFTIRKCRVELVSRNVSAISLHWVLSRPVNTIHVSFKVMKKANGWKKFLYEFKDVDGCALVQGRKRNPVAAFFFSYVKKYSNLNHSCPFENDVILDRLVVSEADVKILPIPLGNYATFSNWTFNGVYAAEIKSYLSYSDYRKDW